MTKNVQFDPATSTTNESKQGRTDPVHGSVFERLDDLQNLLQSNIERDLVVVPMPAEKLALNAPAVLKVSKIAAIDDAFGSMGGSYCITRPTVSIVIPVFNECNSIQSVISRVLQVPFEKQIIVVDDGSTDGTRGVLEKIAQESPIEVFLHAVNQGKGAALQTGFRLAEGEIVIVQDADLEYDPLDIEKVIQPILDNKSFVVYGSRYLNETSKNSSLIHRLGNAMLTIFSNWMTGQRLTDMETCYKAFRRSVLTQIRIEQNRFGFEPEVTAKVSALGFKIAEVPVTYNARDWSEGKKIGLRDLWNAIYCIVRYAPIFQRKQNIAR